MGESNPLDFTQGHLNRDLIVEPNLLTAIIAGVAASIGQTTLTYPFEYAKTVSQLRRNLPDTPRVLNYNQQFKYFFSGCGALNVGNAFKAASRFMIFNSASKFMATDNGKTSAPRVFIAGAMTGFVESLWIIPFENIKTTMIESSLIISKNLEVEAISSKLTKPPAAAQKGTHDEILNKTFHKSVSRHPYIEAKLKWDKYPSSNIFQAIQEIYETRGFRGFLQGTVPTLFRQCGVSAVSFSTYITFRQFFAPHGEELHPYLAFASGLLSSVLVVAVTQPIDVVKTRMQSRETYYLYRNSLNCAYRIFVEEGVKTFWSGWAPRLLKIGTSGGITFSIYQYVENQITAALKEKPFQDE